MGLPSLNHIVIGRSLDLNLKFEGLKFLPLGSNNRSLNSKIQEPEQIHKVSDCEQPFLISIVTNFPSDFER